MTRVNWLAGWWPLTPRRWRLAQDKATGGKCSRRCTGFVFMARRHRARLAGLECAV